MQSFELKIYDDQLQNLEQFIAFLGYCEEAPIRLYVPEGPSLYQCGVMDIIWQSGLIKWITVDTGNEIESLEPATRFERTALKQLNGSGFWEIAKNVIKHYHYDPIKRNDHYRMACFIGRKNMERLAILYWLQKQPFECLLSSMHDDNTQYIEQVDTKLCVDNIHSFQTWISKFDIPSIDNVKVQDQYQKKDFTDRGNQFSRVQYNLLRYYSAFDVELIVETFVRGNTYYPTEKTVRPIVGAKPFVIYGPKHYLTRLKSNGLRTFESCWDESYDKYEGIERWIRIQDVITQIHAWSDVEWSQTMQRARDIANYNKQVFVDNVL